MKISQNLIRQFTLDKFYEEFKKLYGDILGDSEINNLLENNEFVTVVLLPSPLNYQEVDLPSPEFGEYFIALKENGGLKPRFIFRWSRMPTTTVKTIDTIGDIEILNNLNPFEIFCESYEYIIGTSKDSKIDEEFISNIVAEDDFEEKAYKIQEHLETIIENEDPRSSRAEFLIDRLKNIV